MLIQYGGVRVATSKGPSQQPVIDTIPVTITRAK